MSTIGHNSAQASNWIAVSREMRDHPIVGMGNPVKPEDPSRGSFSKYEAWQDLLMEAKWKPFEVSNKGKVVTLQRGQLMAARAWLARRWNWSEKTVRGFIAKLESEFMIRSDKGQSKGQRSGHYANVLTVCNYDIYQTLTELDEMTKGQSQGQSGASQGPVEGQSGASQGPQNNKETRKQEHTDTERESAPKWPDGDFVKVNGTAIYVRLGEKQIQFPYERLDMWAEMAKCPAEIARKIAEAEANGWLSDGAMPDMPSKFLRAQFARWQETDKAPKPQSRKRGNRSRLAEDWSLDLEWRAATKEKFGVSDAAIDAQVERFRRYFLSPDAKEPLKADWKGTWENWIDRAQKRGEMVDGNRQSAEKPRHGRQRSRDVNEMTADEYRAYLEHGYA